MTPTSATARAKSNDADPAVAGIERPTPAGANAPGFGSDVIAEALRSLDIPYIALTPGASYRGLHDSIVNYLGNTKPQMLLCLHEETAVAIAHGYAKVTGEALVTAVHSNVGLMHATMAMFNAWCDRMPVVVLGATGPVDAVKDSHRARPGRAGARIHQMGRPADVTGRRARGHPARYVDCEYRALRAGLY
jgi:Thiamine pyrophosphate enzyme, N-terminal TPP binding domain